MWEHKGVLREQVSKGSRGSRKGARPWAPVSEQDAAQAGGHVFEWNNDKTTYLGAICIQRRPQTERTTYPTLTIHNLFTAHSHPQLIRRSIISESRARELH